MKKSLGSANGVKGTLCRSFDGEYFIRVDNQNNGFTDYYLMHYDLDVTINDETAWFYEWSEDSEKVLDYSPDTLGMSDEDLDAYNEERLVSKFDKGNG